MTGPGITNGVNTITARSGNVVLVQGQSQWFTDPRLFDVTYPTPVDPSQTSDFQLLMIPATAGGRYQLTFAIQPTPLIIIRDGAGLGAGMRPAVGGQAVGTAGQGTTLILESRSSSEYIHLLEGKGADVFVVNNPATHVGSVFPPDIMCEVPWGNLPGITFIQNLENMGAVQRDVRKRLKQADDLGGYGLWPFGVTP
jgi:hypothetical protein